MLRLPAFLFLKRQSDMIETLKQFVIEGGKINEEQATALSRCTDKEALYKAAHQITRH